MIGAGVGVSTPSRFLEPAAGYPASLPWADRWESDVGTTTDAFGVTSWVSRITSADLVQATDSRKPGLVSSVQNGLPALRFAAAEDLAIASYASFPSPAYTVFMVARINATGASYPILWSYNPAPFDLELRGYLNTEQLEYLDADAVPQALARFGSSVGDGSFRTLICIGDTSSNVKLRVNGSEIDSGNVGNAIVSPAKLCLGSRDGSFFFDGDIIDFGILTGVLSAGQLSTLEQAARDRVAHY